MKRSLTLFLAILATLNLPASDENIDAQVAAATLIKERQQAPEFTCQTIDGRQIKLAELKGKVVVLYFFSSNAPFSLKEMKYIETEIHHKLRDREDLVILGIGRGHTREEVVKIAGENKLTFHLTADPASTVSNLYFTKFVPRTVLVRKDGTICYLSNGYKEFDGVLQLMTAVAQELGPKTRLRAN